MKAQIVIGANFGDEGKGLTTDYLASIADTPVVCRFNGGAQAGHTVKTPDGTRHVFHHVGSGSFAHAPTYLSKHFVVNPLAFCNEQNELGSLGKPTTIIVDVEATVSSPFDMLINQAIERQRGSARHGSCGYGIGETVERHRYGEFTTTVLDLLHRADYREKLERIRDEYVPQRLQQLGCTTFDDETANREDLLDQWIVVCDAFISSITTTSGPDYLKRFQTVIFEGAQGLLLDEFHHWFPHVTRSRTGVYNAVEILNTIGLSEAEVFYATRSYLTRHGAGPLPFEVPYKIYPDIEDKTNFENEFQGLLRFAPLNLDLLKASITNDLATVKDKGVVLKPNLVVSCMDQLPEQVRYVKSGIILENYPCELEKALSKIHNFEKILYSYGPTRQTLVTP